MIVYLIMYSLLFFPSAFAMKKMKLPQLKIVTRVDQDKLDESEESWNLSHAPNPLYFNDKISPCDEAILTGAFNAAYKCDLNRLRNLVTKSNVNQVNNKGYPAIFAAIRGSFEIDKPLTSVINVLDFLMDMGASIDVVQGRQEMSALAYSTHRAIRSPNLNCLALFHFLKQGADPFLAPSSKTSAFDISLSYAMQNDPQKYPHAEMVLKIFQNEAKTLHHAVRAFNPERVKKLADATSVQEYNDDRKKPLYTAIVNFTPYNAQPMLEVIQALLNAGAHPNEGIMNMALPGNTHLTVATTMSIVRGHTGMIPPLIEAGGDPYKELVPAFSPSAHQIAYIAAHLSEKDIEKQSKQGFPKKIKRIKANQQTAEDILTLFYQNKSRN